MSWFRWAEKMSGAVIRYVWTALRGSISRGARKARLFRLRRRSHGLRVRQKHHDFHRRRRAGHIELPSWRSNPVLLPVLMAGRWDRSNVNDCEVLARLAGVERYEELQQQLTPILNVERPAVIEGR